MLGTDLRNWFELFDGLAVYRPTAAGGHAFDGWLNCTDIEDQFTSSKVTFAGARYEPTDQTQREKFLNVLIGYASTFVFLRLMERRRQMIPPSLDYKLTPLGRRVGNWGYGPRPGFKKQTFFFVAAVFLRTYKYKWLIAAGAAGWAVLNAFKFYAAAMSWAVALPFAAWSAVAVGALVALGVFLKAKLG